MRAVNLIPNDLRRGPLAGRGGEIASYAILGGLAAVLVAVLALVFTSNQISDREADVARLQQQEIDAQARADALQPFANFATMQQQRTATIDSLAKSRFDWERIMRELSIVLPSDVWLTQLSGTVLPEVQLENQVSVSSRTSITGPALEIVGCAPGQDSVASFVSALEDIDGVTRVGVQSSAKSDAGASTASGGESVSDDCRTRDFIYQFEIVAAFDAVAVPAAASAGAPSAPVPPADDGGVGEAQEQRAAADQSSADLTAKARRQAANVGVGD